MQRHLYLFFLLLLASACQEQAANYIDIHIPTAEEEAAYVWRTIQDTKFFEENNYQVSLPKGTFIDSLKRKAVNRQLSDEDYERLNVFIRDEVYRKADYTQGAEKIEARRVLINQMIAELIAESYSWKFKAFDQYRINLTLYGPGGSFNPDEGSILIFTTPEGKFKSYDDPANTIIHEIIHIGIDQAIIQAHQVPHTLKERIVDTFVFLHFAELLPDYRVQNMGETRTDTFLKTSADLKKLDEVVKKILNE